MKQIATIILVLISLTSFGQGGTKFTIKGSGSNVGDSVKKNTDTLGIYKTLVYPNIVNTTTNTSNISLKRNISDTAGNAGVTTIFQVNKSKDSLQVNIQKNTDTLLTKFATRDSAIVRKVSRIFPTRFSYIAYPQILTGIGGAVTEYGNYGNAAGATDSVALSNTAYIGIQGRALMIRNAKWDSTGGNYKWLTPIQGTTGYGSSMVEAGSDGVNLHSSPAGVNFSDVAHVGFRSSATGTTTPSANSRFTTGYYNQTFRPLIGIWDSSVYVYGSNEAVSWSTTSSAEPIFWANAVRGKGVENELIRAEENYTNGWPGIYFAKSRNVLNSKTAVNAGDTLGKLGWRVYDGSAYQTGASIDAFAAATATAGVAPANIRFQTSLTNTAGLRTRMQINADSTVKFYNTSNRFELPSTTTSIPDWTGVGFSPALSSSTNGMMQSVGTTTGGILLYGFSTNSNTATSLLLRGWGGGTSPSVANTIFRVNKHDGSTNTAALASTEIGWQWDNNGTVKARMMGDGSFVAGSASSPTSTLQSGGSFATAYVAKTGTYTATAADNLIDCTSGTFTVTLPTAAGITGREYWITNTGSGTITIGTTSSQTFANVTATPTTLSVAQFSNYRVVSNGTGWLAYKIVN